MKIGKNVNFICSKLVIINFVHNFLCRNLLNSHLTAGSCQLKLFSVTVIMLDKWILRSKLFFILIFTGLDKPVIWFIFPSFCPWKLYIQQKVLFSFCQVLIISCLTYMLLVWFGKIGGKKLNCFLGNSFDGCETFYMKII